MKYIKIIILSIVLVFSCLLLFENHETIRPIDECNINKQLTIGSNITYPESIEKYVKEALRFYPELKETTIEFRYKEQSIAHTVRPDLGKILDPWVRRKYYINISQNLATPIKDSMFEYLSDSARIGVLVHELGHVLDYEGKSVFQIISLATRYVASEKFINRYERSIDHKVVARCGGKYLEKWSRQTQAIFEADGREGRYLTPAEILQLMEEQ